MDELEAIFVLFLILLCMGACGCGGGGGTVKDPPKSSRPPPPPPQGDG